MRFLRYFLSLIVILCTTASIGCSVFRLINPETYLPPANMFANASQVKFNIELPSDKNAAERINNLIAAYHSINQEIDNRLKKKNPWITRRRPTLAELNDGLNRYMFSLDEDCTKIHDIMKYVSVSKYSFKIDVEKGCSFFSIRTECP